MELKGTFGETKGAADFFRQFTPPHPPPKLLRQLEFIFDRPTPQPASVRFGILF